MSTRSVCAVPRGDAWIGRYVHSDGYPSHMVPTYLELVARDGLEVVVRKMTEDRYGWSSLDSSQPDITGVKVPKLKKGESKWARFDYGTPEHYADALAPGGSYGDGRFANEPGYGIGYTTEQGQSSADEWITADGDNWGTEWCYILSPGGLFVLEHTYPEPGNYDESEWVFRGLVAWGSSDDGTSYEKNYAEMSVR